MFKEIRLNVSYDDYIGPAVLWATGGTKSLTEALDVIRVVAMGSHISGLFGGEKKRGIERYAGLVVNDLRVSHDRIYIRLFNTEKEYMVPAELMKRHGIDVFKVYYVGRINPFKCSTLSVILSSIHEKKLREFIEELIRLNKDAMTEADKRRLEKLSKEVKTRINVLDGKHYVIYRSNRVFSACVPEDLDRAISEANTAYAECRSAEQAYYYAAVLNYLAFKATGRGGFLRHQLAKPLLAIVMAGLAWKDVPAELRDEIAKLSFTLSKKLSWVDYPTQKKAILETAKMDEFARIIELLDKHVESEGKQEMLEEALDLVSDRVRQVSKGSRAPVRTPMSKILHDSAWARGEG